MTYEKKIFALVSLLLGWAAAAEVVTVDRDGQTFYQLSNEYLTVLINPNYGGRVEQFCQNGRGNLVEARGDDVAPGGSGIGQERLRCGGAAIDLTSKAKWQVVASGDNGGGSFVTLENGDSPLHLVKTYTLKDHTASLQVDYAIDNPGKEDFFGALWFITVPFPEGTGNIRYLYPFAEHAFWPDFVSGRTTQQAVNWPETSGDITVNNAVAGWAAALNDAGDGILLETSYPDLRSFYNWLPGETVNQPTLEYLTAELKIRPLAMGQAMIQARPEREDPLFDFIFRTSYTVTPLYGCRSVEAADNHIAAAMTRENGRLKATLWSDRDYGDVSVRCGGGMRKIALKALQEVDVEFPLPDDEPLVTLELTGENGRKIAALTRSFDEKHRPEPAAEKNKIFAYAPAYAEFFTDFSKEIIRWNADAAEKTRLLLFATAWSHHDSAELTKRGNFDFELVEVAYPHQIAFDAGDNRSWVAPEPVSYARSVIENDYDAIMISSAIRWEVLPEEVQEKIGAKVEAGAGLVYVNPPYGIESTGLALRYNEAETVKLNRAVPYDKLNALPAGDDRTAMPLKVYDCGAGKVISVDYVLNQNPMEWMIDSYGMIPNPDFELGCPFNYYDYHFSQILRAIRLAAQTALPAEITGLTAGEGQLTLAVTAVAAVEGTVTLEVRDKYGEVVDRAESEAALQTGRNELPLALPLEKMTLDGDYFYNVFLRVDGHTADWYTVVQNRPADCALEQLSLARKTFQAGEPVAGTIRLRGNLDGAELVMVVRDIYDRVLYRRTLTGLQPEMPFAATLETPPQTNLSTVEAALFKDGRQLDRAETFWTTKLPPRSGLTFTSWGACSNYFADDYYRVLAETGFDETVGYHAEYANLALQRTAAEAALRNDVNYVALGIGTILGWIGEERPESTSRPTCLSNPAYLQELRDTAETVAANLADYSPNLYFIGDECSLFHWDLPHDYCQSQWCLAAFRRWLQDRYASLDELNAAWRTDFAAWEDVKPDTAAEAIEKQRFASFIDHRHFMFTTVTGAIKAEYDGMKAGDPQGNLAISGMVLTNLYTGFDWHEALKYLTRAVAYDQPNTGVDDVLRSFARPGTGLGDWTGYNMPVRDIREKTYREILAGLRANGNWANGYFMRHGDLKLNHYGEQLRDMIFEIKQSGLDVITEPANREPSPFALYFSIPAMLTSDASDFLGYIVADKRNYHRNFGGWTAVLGNLGYQGPLVVGPEELPKLDPVISPYLILPLAQAMSDADIEAIERYVAAGGRLIADVLPGGCYDNGTVRQNNPFREIFGVDAKFRSGFGGQPGELLAVDGREVEIELGDPAVTVTGGRPLFAADRRIMIGRDGHLLLNFLPNRYGRIRTRDALAEPVLALFRTAFKAAGVADEWQLQLPAAAEAGRYRRGDCRFVGMTRMAAGKEEKKDAVLQFERPYYIYDLLERRLLARSDRLETALESYGVRLLALLPEPTQPYSLHLERDGRLLKVRIGGSEADGIFRLEVYRPDGTLFKPATGNHFGAGSAGIEIIVDDGIEPHPGEWRVRVINLLDDQVTERSIRW